MFDGVHPHSVAINFLEMQLQREFKGEIYLFGVGKGRKESIIFIFVRQA